MPVHLVYITVDLNAQTPLNLFYNIAVPVIQHPLGWVRYGHTFKITNNPKEAEIQITLLPQAEMDKAFPSFAADRLSLCNMETKEIFVNEDRWLRRYPDMSQLQLPAYRAYVLQHEIGHALGKGHAKCKQKGERAPVMLQQTLGLKGCIPYPFPFYSCA